MRAHPDRLLLLALALVGLGAPVATTDAVSAPKRQAAEVPKEVIAVQLRRQGKKCTDPESATRDEKDSKPDEAAWILKCKEATYRVRLIPNMAAEVEVVSDQADDAAKPEPASTAAPSAEPK